MSANSLDVQPVAANHRLECIVGSIALGNEQLGVAQVADARREPESQKVHQAEHMIGEARRVGVVFLDTQVRLVVQQAIEHIGRVAQADVDHLGAEGVSALESASFFPKISSSHLKSITSSLDFHYDHSRTC